VLKAARLGERYDLAIIAGEGYATEACRALFAAAERGWDCQLFTLHDADPYGYNIARTLREETRRMPGYKMEVIDLGLRLKDALEMGLQTEDFTRLKGLPQGLELSALEREHFEGRRASPKSWACRRVELNALTSPALVRYIEDSLHAAGVRGKVLSPDEALPASVEDLYRGVVSEAVAAVLEEVLPRGPVAAAAAELFRDRVGLAEARSWAEEAFAEDPSVSWREAIRRRIRSAVEAHRPELRASVVAAAVKALRGGPTR
jgi:hypothetical protein